MGKVFVKDVTARAYAVMVFHKLRKLKWDNMSIRIGMNMMVNSHLAYKAYV